MFDIRSVFLVGSLTALVCAVMLWSLRDLHRNSSGGMKLAALGEACLGLAMLSIALRGKIPDLISIPLANSAGVVGSLIFYESVRRLTGATPSTRLLIIVAVSMVGLQLYWGVDPAYHLHRICLTSAVQGVTAVALIPLLLGRLNIDPRVPLQWGIGFAGFFAAAHFLRLAQSVSTGVQLKSGGMVGGNVAIEGLAALFALTPMVFAMVMVAIVNGRIALDFKRLANTDSLTGLASRRRFFEVAQHFLGKAAQDPGRGSRVPLLMMLDLDHFKAINDSLGHLAGDAVLARFAWAMRGCVPNQAVLGRYGGEEFCLLLPASTPAAAAQIAADIAQAARRLAIESSGEPLRLTVSIGVASVPDDGIRVEELIAAADRRVYMAKSQGRDRVVLTDDQLYQAGSTGGPDDPHRRQTDRPVMTPVARAD
ncbi:MAG: GGDEF domain-containing protein [Burkholderiaceae bacterium]